MTPKQKVEACIALAPNFRVCVEYTTLQSSPRVLKWYGRRLADMNEMSAGIVFPEGNAFEPIFDELLTRALAAL